MWRANHALRESAGRTAANPGLAFTLTPVRLPLSRFEPFTAPAGYKSAAIFEGSLFIGSRSSLTRFDSQGRPKQIWRIGRDLPPAQLSVLCVRHGIGTPELWIATDGQGILIFDGQVIRQLLPQESATRKVSALLPLGDGRVLFGTPEAGLYVTDGKHLELFHPQFAKVQVTALAGNEDAIWVGTRTAGVWLWHGGQITRFRDELPDPQVLSLATAGGKAWVGTPVGIAEFEGQQFKRKLADGFFAQSMAEWHDTLYVSSVDEGTAALNIQANDPARRRGNELPAIESAYSFLNTGDKLLAIEAEGAIVIPTGERITAAAENSLADSHIAALQVDSQNHLWVGYFDRGLDILPLFSSQQKRHIENDQVFCVNRIKSSPDGNTVAVATANGLLVFDLSGRLRQVMNRKTGLLADHVTDVLFTGSEQNMVIGTPAGLTFVRDGRATSIYAFQGLVNNHVYTLADFKEGGPGETFAGTLGGFSLLKNDVVQASYTTANSDLRQNWITASSEAWGDLYLGTYGSGVVKLSPNGDLSGFREFAPHEGRFEINPNAMLAANDALYAGTAGQGLALLKRGAGRWRFVTAGLPSLNITALAEKNGTLYVGTDNGLVRIAENDLDRL